MCATSFCRSFMRENFVALLWLRDNNFRGNWNNYPTRIIKHRQKTGLLWLVASRNKHKKRSEFFFKKYLVIWFCFWDNTGIKKEVNWIEIGQKRLDNNIDNKDVIKNQESKEAKIKSKSEKIFWKSLHFLFKQIWSPSKLFFSTF